MPLLDINDNLIENADENSKNKGTKRKKASDQSNLIDTVLIKLPRATENLEIIDTDIKRIVFDFISNNQLIYLNVLNPKQKILLYCCAFVLAIILLFFISKKK